MRMRVVCLDNFSVRMRVVYACDDISVCRSRVCIRVIIFLV